MVGHGQRRREEPGSGTHRTSVGDLERLVRVRKYRHCEAEYSQLAKEPNTMSEVRDRYLRIGLFCDREARLRNCLTYPRAAISSPRFAIPGTKLPTCFRPGGLPFQPMTAARKSFSKARWGEACCPCRCGISRQDRRGSSPHPSCKGIREDLNETGSLNRAYGEGRGKPRTSRGSPLMIRFERFQARESGTVPG